MTVYLCAYATRIQTWLARTPKLKLVRGASQALRVETGIPAVQAWLDLNPHLAAVTICQDAGDVDGVVVLAAADAADADAAALPLLRLLHEKLPGLPWAAWLHESDGYLRSFHAAEVGDPSVKRFSLLASTQEFGLARSCESCRAETALGGSVHPHPEGPEGPDCRARRAQATPDSTWDAIPGKWPDDFDDLAREGGLAATSETAPSPKGAVGRRDSRNHLATIIADGNRIGSFFSHLAEADPPQQGLRRDAVAILDEAIHEAVEIAAQASGSTDATTKVAIPHYVGGDDVLVSVPASVAWRFAATLASEFEARFRAGLTRSLLHNGEVSDQLLDEIGEVSLGIGMVFAHQSHPFSDSQSLAHHAMKEAKRSQHGRAGAVGWVDLTAGDSRTDVHVVTAHQIATELADSSTEPATFALPPSARQQLAMIVRDAPPVDGRSNKGVIADKLTDWSKRTNRSAGADAEHLPAVLSRARWWPTTQRTEPAHDEKEGRS